MIFLSCVLFAVYAGAQQSAPILISHTDSTRAISFDSVTRQREPFSRTTQIKFGADNATRIMLFAMNLNLQPGDTAGDVTAEAEDAAHNVYTLVVENIGKVPDQPWATSIVMRLDSNLPETGDVLVRIRYRSLASNRVRVGIGQVGGGPPDDIAAIPTPGLPGPFEPPANVAATNLASTDVQTIIQQAASAAEAFGRPVTMARPGLQVSP